LPDRFLGGPLRPIENRLKFIDWKTRFGQNRALFQKGVVFSLNGIPMEVSLKDPGIGPPSPTRGIIVGMDVDFYQKSSKTPQFPSTYEVPAWSMFSNFAI